MAVHPRQLDRQSRVRQRRGPARSLLQRLEQAGGPALDHHISRATRLGLPVLISEPRYKGRGQ